MDKFSVYYMKNRGQGGQNFKSRHLRAGPSSSEGADYAHQITTGPRIFRPSYGPEVGLLAYIYIEDVSAEVGGSKV